MKKFIKVFLVVMVGVIGFAGGVYADNIIQSLDVTYDNSLSGLESTNVQDALDELYVKAGGKIIGNIEYLTNYITYLYVKATKTTVENNSIPYNYASELGLMNDRLGNVNVGIDDGNIRYYGKNPNNYIYFNCDTYPVTNCEKWRIIGLFKDIKMADGTTQDLIKVARTGSIGTFSWDYTSAKKYDNNWTDSTLNKLLNQAFYTKGTIVYYNNSTTGNSYSFASTGIKNDITRNMIAEVVWNLGGHNSAAVYSDQMYGYERGTAVYSGRPTEWPGKIALMYVSDYGYATDFNGCTAKLSAYNTAGCYDNNWLYQTNASHWLLTPRSGVEDAEFLALSTGSVFDYNHVYSLYGVVPAFYLTSELQIEEGHTGTIDDPYRFKIDE